MERTVIALGFFDGVHRGHGALLQKTAERGWARGAEPAVFTFDRPPKEVVTGQPVYLINSPEDRQALIRRLYGIDRIILAGQGGVSVPGGLDFHANRGVLRTVPHKKRKIPQ